MNYCDDRDAIDRRYFEVLESLYFDDWIEPVEYYEPEYYEDELNGSIHFWNNRDRDRASSDSRSREDLIHEGLARLAEEYEADWEEQRQTLWPRAHRALQRQHNFRQRRTGKARKIVRASRRRGDADWFFRSALYSISKRCRFDASDFSPDRRLKRERQREADCVEHLADDAADKRETARQRRRSAVSASLAAKLGLVAIPDFAPAPAAVDRRPAPIDLAWSAKSPKTLSWIVGRSGRINQLMLFPPPVRWTEGRDGRFRWARSFEVYPNKSE
jgi:hypothetical protein